MTRNRYMESPPAGAALALVLLALPASADDCGACHREIAASFSGTAHFRTSQPATAASILGSFDDGRNVLRTRAAGTYFVMERREDGFYQTGHQAGKARSARFDLVIGSGRRGQSYLYWRGGLLFQLPVSYLAAAGEWMNSPGYADGAVHFDRLIPPRCLECHTTRIRSAVDSEWGIGCAKCHGRGADHSALVNPARFSRDRALDLCGWCHSGIREPIRPSFTYRPGQELAEYLLPEDGHAEPDVHGNQVGLLRSSRCFQRSPEMTCANCHNVHREERDLAAMARKCESCHEPGRCAAAARLGGRIAGGCVLCHMPEQRSKVITIQTRRAPFAQPYRTHAIGIYRGAAREILARAGL